MRYLAFLDSLADVSFWTALSGMVPFWIAYGLWNAFPRTGWLTEPASYFFWGWMLSGFVLYVGARLLRFIEKGRLRRHGPW